MENIITKEKLKAELANVKEAVKKSNETVVGYNKEMQTIAAKKNGELVELARLNGEERALKRLLSTLDTEEKETL